MNISIINPLDYPNWDELILDSGAPSVFNSKYWADVLTSSYNFKPIYFAHISKNKLNFLLPMMEVQSKLTGKRGISLPFSDRSDIITNDEINIDEIFKQVKDYGLANKWKYFELRNNILDDKKITPSVSFYEHYLDLTPGGEKLYNNLRSNTKRNLKKALKTSVNIEIDNSLKALDQYFKLHCITRKRQGVPPQPYNFFKTIHSKILLANKGKIFLAKINSDYIGGLVFFEFGDQVIYKYGASDLEYQFLRVNNLLMWNAIEYYTNNNYKSLYFGRTEFSNPGLRQYKMGWNPQESLSHYYKYSFMKQSYVKDSDLNNKITSFIFNHLPIKILRIFGNLMYKHFA